MRYQVHFLGARIGQDVVELLSQVTRPGGHIVDGRQGGDKDALAIAGEGDLDAGEASRAGQQTVDQDDGVAGGGTRQRRHGLEPLIQRAHHQQHGHHENDLNRPHRPLSPLPNDQRGRHPSRRRGAVELGRVGVSQI